MLLNIHLCDGKAPLNFEQRVKVVNGDQPLQEMLALGREAYEIENILSSNFNSGDTDDVVLKNVVKFVNDRINFKRQADEVPKAYRKSSVW